jgi:ABC-2 type transport system permease protein
VIRSVAAELLVTRKRLSTWILLGIWTLLALLFAYVVPYVAYLNDPSRNPLIDVLPGRLVGTLLAGFPFFGGVFALQLGVLAFGSDYGWGTLKTLFIQRPPRLHVFVAKLLALAVALVPFVLVVFAVGALASSAIAVREGADVAWPSAWLVLRGIGAACTALAVGIGVLYALVIERLLSALAGEISAVDRLVEFFIRANAYSLVSGLGVSASDVADNGPGSFSGPFVGTGQSLAVLGAYLAVFLVAAAAVLWRRDVA